MEILTILDMEGRNGGCPGWVEVQLLVVVIIVFIVFGVTELRHTEEKRDR